MKTLLFFFALTAGYFKLPAQGVFTNDTHSALQSIIYEFNKGFSSSKGPQISSSGGKSEYKYNQQLPGILSSTITQYKLAGRDISSWKAILYAGSDYNQAAQKYKEVFDQIVNAIVKSADAKPYILNGTYSQPDPSSNNSIAFMLLPFKGDLKNIKVEISMENIKGWIIYLRVYDRRFK